MPKKDGKDSSIVEVSVTSLAHGGAGIARHAGKVVFVPRALPGDRVRVRLVKAKKRFARAEIVALVEASKKRVDPRCAAFDAGCGGCQWLHLRYADQLHAKGANLREALKRIGGINVTVPPVVAAKPIHGCRNKFSLSVGDHGKPGLCREHSREVLALPDCRMECPENLEAYHALDSIELPRQVYQVELRADGRGAVGMCMYCGHYDRDLHDLGKTMLQRVPGLVGVGVKTRERYTQLAGLPALEWANSGVRYRIPHQSFFQTNYQQACELAGVVRRLSCVRAGDRVLDLYCGVGFFALNLASFGAVVTGVEQDADAVEAAREGAAINGLKDSRFLSGDAGRFVEGVEPGSYESIIIDPPRSGCDPAVLEAVGRAAPRRIIYVSCAPDTLARDLARILPLGYAPAELRAVDMFPHTYHLETVVRLERAGGQNSSP